MRNARLLAGLTALWLGTAAAWAQTEKPQYGGALEIVTIYPTLSALSWDLADWNWKHNHDTGQFYEQLFAADLSKSSARAASIRSMPTRGCPPTRSAASSPKAGSGRTIRCASRSSCARASCFRRSRA